MSRLANRCTWSRGGGNVVAFRIRASEHWVNDLTQILHTIKMKHGGDWVKMFIKFEVVGKLILLSYIFEHSRLRMIKESVTSEKYH